MLQHRLGNFHLPAAAYGPSTDTAANQPQASGAARHQGRLYYDPTGSLGNADNAQAAGASQALVSPRDFAKSPHFESFKQEYHGLVDNLGSYLLKHHGVASAWHQEQEAKLKGPGQHSVVSLSTEQLMAQASAKFHQMSRSGERVPDWINSLHTLHEFKQRLFDFNESGQNPHYPTDDELALAYGSLKHELEGLETLLGSDHYPAEAKVQSALEVGIASGKCAAGLEEEAQQQKSTLRASVAGLPLKVATTRDQIALQTLEKMAGASGAFRGDIRHVAVALYNHLKPEFGLGDLAGSGNWSTTLDRMGRDAEGTQMVLQRSREVLDRQLSTTGVLSHVATEGLQSLHGILGGLSSFKGKDAAALDEMDMFALNKELNASKDFKALSENYGESEGLPLHLAFVRQPDDSFRLTQNPLKFELHLMKQLHQQGIGVETEPRKILARGTQDQDGNPLQLNFGHWDDLVFVTEHEPNARPLPLEKQDHEFITTHHLKQITPQDLAQQPQTRLGQPAFAPAALSQEQKALCQLMLGQGLKNSDVQQWMTLPHTWLAAAHPPMIQLATDKIAQLDDPALRMRSLKQLVESLPHDTQRNAVINSPGFVRVMQKCQVADLLDKHSRTGLSPFLQVMSEGASASTFGHLLDTPEAFPRGVPGLKLLSALMALMHKDPKMNPERASAALTHVLNAIRPEDLLKLPAASREHLPKGPFFAIAQALPAEQRVPWLQQLVAQYLDKNDDIENEAAISAAMDQLPDAAQKHDFARDALRHFGIGQLFLMVAIKHDMLDLLADVMPVDNRSPQQQLASLQQLAQQPKYRSAIDGNSLLHFAVDYSHQKLLQALADTPLINSRNKHRFTPIHWALITGRMDAARALINHPNAKPDLELDSVEWCLDLLQKKGVAVDDYPKDELGLTPLAMSLLTARTDELIPDFLRNGANIYAGLPSPFELALIKGDPDTLQALLTPDNIGDALQELTRIPADNIDNFYGAAAMLLEKGARIDVTDDDETTLLTQAMIRDSRLFDLMKPYITPEILNKQSRHGECCLSVAITKNDLPRVRELLQMGADTELTFPNGRPLFSLAQSDEMRALLNLGGDE
ncbi:ankyrin repeat domain-containing protein [Pokkaliibacter sp. CJK22405]|uniref:ankyrin repeat domain-containing protein n=1 Tax=Pokkaliibacter sp. CJK22405 TaxID=3384615 RepID=UPI0039854C2D